ncbi:Uncharacterized protein TCM_011168 [Theobroma cacao]|uniref:Reverse transcriptase domain-containing protein n=1 Tax=Theobroma cacao TaxID=3641 RepID=A0A061EA37_THECC|nr:Uncharacterized protein TCM_011168 [Theobroma cacao]
MSILVIGSLSKIFDMQRGLRQGCPMSPFLFNLVAEGFSCLMKEVERKGLFNGILVGRNGLSVSHLQFADDTMIFGYPDLEQIRNIKRVLRIFQLMSGLKINFAKSSLMEIDMEPDIIEEWAFLLDVHPYFGFALGDRGNIRFWIDEWFENGSLKKLFPRIYALVENKSGTVKEFGEWLNGIWEWKVKLRWNIFGWEQEQHNSFINTIRGIAPHKTKVQVWQFLHGKAAVKGCKSVTSLWYDWCKEWGLAWDMPARYKELVVMWNAIKMTSNCDRIWKTAMFTITWTVWLGKNDVHSASSILDIYRYLAADFNQQRDRDTRPQTIWEKPRAGVVKFNVDGVANGCPSKAVIVLKKRVIDWKIRHMLREGNREIDQLAKEGVGREVDLIEFYNPI